MPCGCVGAPCALFAPSAPCACRIFGAGSAGLRRRGLIHHLDRGKVRRERLGEIDRIVNRFDQLLTQPLRVDAGNLNAGTAQAAGAPAGAASCSADRWSRRRSPGASRSRSARRFICGHTAPGPAISCTVSGSSSVEHDLRSRRARARRGSHSTGRLRLRAPRCAPVRRSRPRSPCRRTLPPKAGSAMPTVLYTSSMMPCDSYRFGSTPIFGSA